MPYKAREVLARLQRRVRGKTAALLACRFATSGWASDYVAMHTKDVPSGTFRSILMQAKLTEDEFRNL